MKKLFCALLLPVASAAWAADDPYTTGDHRTPITVSAKERNQILYEMREFLHGLFNIHQAMARGDMKAVAVEAKPLGQMVQRLPTDVTDKMPEGFMQMSLAMHEAFDQLAKSAETKPDFAPMQHQLAEIMTYCSGCHDTYRLEVAAAKPAPAKKAAAKPKTRR
jgi:cytochrome c556